MSETRQDFSVVLVGCGNMGAAIAAGMRARIGKVEIVAVDPNVERARELLQDEEITAVSEFGALNGRQFNICILATKPQHVGQAMAAAQFYLSEDAVVVSIAAGTPISLLQETAPNLRRFVRVMPNLPALASSAMSVGFASDGTLSDEDRAVVEAIFTAIGCFSWLVSEDEIDLATGVTGSGPGYVFAFVEHLQHAAEQMGFPPELSEQFARQTVIGAARLLEQDRRSAHDLKVAVTSPGGTTAAGLQVLESPGALPSLLIHTTTAAAKRAAELARIQQ
ncbi:pyrroline-5-carboxylate reductase (plasmid) [Agrobacterium salinitolerans]|uniref:pyrroline-5-carboxylate reductase n=1 Tax=Agrobacterium salinitolerans TaxID=1183413 RepID=UPI001C22A206|nr:pyrroline-5-carboxylate reductase [Agrobacterium salinitolerans]QXC52921.1 pyrroline-5-carboxylate reductase [Agrobacterium salinitolerans]